MYYLICHFHMSLMIFFLSKSVNIAQAKNMLIKFLAENADKKNIFHFNFDIIKHEFVDCGINDFSILK